MGYVYTQWNTIWPQEKINLVICININDPGGCFAKWNKPDTKRQVLPDFTYMWNLKKSQSQKQQNDGCQGLGQALGRIGRQWSKGPNFQLKEE